MDSDSEYEEGSQYSPEGSPRGGEDGKEMMGKDEVILEEKGESHFEL